MSRVHGATPTEGAPIESAPGESAPAGAEVHRAHAHEHGHRHGREHAHAHSHASATTARSRLLVALAVSAAILLTEVVGAVLTGSLALLVDAAHMLTDTLGLVVALVAAVLVARPPSARRTWGWQRAEVLAAGAQAGILLVVGVYAVVEGVVRLLSPPHLASGGMLWVGVVALVGNVLALLVLAGGRGGSLSMRAAFLEVASDALGAAAVIVAAVVVAATGWERADTVAALVVAVLILPRSLALLRESGAILLETVPEGLDLEDVRAHVLALEHVVGVHDLHASTVATGLPTLSAHVVLDDECFTSGHCAQLLDELQACVAGHFEVGVEHSTFQLEPASHASHEHHAHA